MEKVGEFFFHVDRKYDTTVDKLFVPKLDKVNKEFTEEECMSYLKPFEDEWIPNGKMFGYIVVYDNGNVELLGENDYNRKQSWFDPEFIWSLTYHPSSGLII